MLLNKQRERESDEKLCQELCFETATVWKFPGIQSPGIQSAFTPLQPVRRSKRL